MKFGYNCYSIKNKDALHQTSLSIQQTILTFFQIKIAPSKLVLETCTYTGKQHYLPLNAQLNVQMLLLWHMWSSFVFYSWVCDFFLFFCVDVLFFCNTIKMYFLHFQRKINKYVTHWHISSYTGQFSMKRMLIKLESKWIWTRTCLLVGEVCNKSSSLWKMGHMYEG